MKQYIVFVEAYHKSKPTEYKENTVTLEQLEEEVFKACQMGIYIEQTQYTDSQKEIIETYFKNEVLPKYKRDE